MTPAQHERDVRRLVAMHRPDDFHDVDSMAAAQVPPAIAEHPPIEGDAGACRACGCTEDFACVSDQGEACAWAEADLCTACVEIAGRIFGAPALRFLMVACGVIAPNASTTRPGADALTAEGVLALRATLKRLLDSQEAETPADG